MKRRTFLTAAGTSSIGASALLGSGAFSSVVAEREVSIEVTEDSDAYLGLDKCDTPNGSYAYPDDGRLKIYMNEDNPNRDDTPLGKGANPNATSVFHQVFKICNQGNEPTCVWIEDDDDWPRLEGEESPRRVEFYLEDDRDTSVIGEENAILLEVGSCVCVGIAVKSHGLEVGDSLLQDLDDQITIVADVDGKCTPADGKCLDCGDEEDPDNADKLAKITLENTGSTKDVKVEHMHPQFGGTFFEEEIDGGESFTLHLDELHDGRPEIAFYIDGTKEKMSIYHPEGGQKGDTFHYSCSQPVVIGEPLHFDSGPGNALVVKYALDKEGNEIC